MPKTNHLEIKVKDSGDGVTIVKCFMCYRIFTIPADVTAREHAQQYYRFTDHHRHCGKIYDAYHFSESKVQEAV